ncbi:MAG: hypothetical protein NT001_04795, partial [Candidatus Woesearchaeota archaeon]|nr:hypothetical protein [Candidatus Woesearchaeota archaeon]
MKNEQKIIRFLIDRKDEPFSINSIAKQLKMNYRIAFEGVKKLEKEGIVAIKRLGNSNQCVFSYHFNEKILEAENQKKNDFLKNKTFKVIYNRLMEIKNPF